MQRHRTITAVLALLMAVLDAPLPARALLFDFLPGDLRALGASEPAMLVLTGLLLLSLARVGGRTTRPRAGEREVVVPPAGDVLSAQGVAPVRSAKRAA